MSKIKRDIDRFTPWEELPDAMFIEEVAKKLGRDRNTIAAMAESGTIPAKRVGARSWMFGRDEIRHWLGYRAEAPAPEEPVTKGFTLRFTADAKQAEAA